MKSPVVKRSIVVGGHKTSISLEEAFWGSMNEISAERSVTLSKLVGEIDSSRQLARSSLSSKRESPPGAESLLTKNQSCSEYQNCLNLRFPTVSAESRQ
jgi:hypothetical protein